MQNSKIPIWLLLLIGFLLIIWIFRPTLAESIPPETATSTIEVSTTTPERAKFAFSEGLRLTEAQRLNEAIIASLAKEKGVNQTLAVAIAYCESGYKEKAKNPSSSATGLFQILKGTWANFECEGYRDNAEDNAKCGIKILKESGSHHWNESKSCWQGKLM